MNLTMENVFNIKLVQLLNFLQSIEANSGNPLILKEK